MADYSDMIQTLVTREIGILGPEKTLHCRPSVRSGTMGNWAPAQEQSTNWIS